MCSVSDWFVRFKKIVVFGVGRVAEVQKSVFGVGRVAEVPKS